MIVRLLVDLNNEGNLYLFTVQTEDYSSLLNILKSQSQDVRFVETKSSPSRWDIGTRVLSDGSTVLRCQFFCDKVSSTVRARHKCVLEKAVVV